MKISKYAIVALLVLITTSLLAASCHKHSIPRKNYRGMPPRGPRK